MRSEKPTAVGGKARQRIGRPRTGQAGEVDRRILDTAADLFLRHGFDATSCDQVAVQAHAGKATLYARFSNKAELFEAVVRDKVRRTLIPSEEIPWDQPLRGRLQAVGEALLVHVLQPETVAFMRVVLSTAHRMPELARSAVRIGREGGVGCVTKAIVGNKDATLAALEQANPVASKFIDLAFVPHQMRALFGDEPAVLEADAPDRVADAISLLSSSGWLRHWE